MPDRDRVADQYIRPAPPYRSRSVDPDDPFVETVWWVNQELLHHGAEIALIRDLWRARRR